MDIDDILAGPETTIREVMKLLGRNRKGIVLLVDTDNRLIGTLTDGDIRRAMLANDPQDQPAASLLERKTGSRYELPVTAPAGTSNEELLKLMYDRAVRQVPLLDDEGRVVDLAAMDDLLSEEIPRLQAVVMAGGFGKRLRPLTDDTPKPMLPVGDKPILEHTVEQLKQVGIHRINITTHYQPEKIEDHFGDGSEFGVDIEYVSEERPLGTAGAVGLVDFGSEPMLVINGDILTRVDLQAMFRYHRKHQADMTLGVRQYDFKVPYGVVDCEGPQVRGINEKPEFAFLVNAGIYLLEPSVRQFIPPDEQFDMTDLMDALIAEGRKVVSFPIVEYWLDIGRIDDYKKAQADIKDGKL